jgi:hypothetical protein
MSSAIVELAHDSKKRRVSTEVDVKLSQNLSAPQKTNRYVETHLVPETRPRARSNQRDRELCDFFLAYSIEFECKARDDGDRRDPDEPLFSSSERPCSPVSSLWKVTLSLGEVIEEALRGLERSWLEEDDSVISLEVAAM